MARRYRNYGKNFSSAQKASYYAGMKAGKKMAFKQKRSSYNRFGR